MPRPAAEWDASGLLDLLALLRGTFDEEQALALAVSSEQISFVVDRRYDGRA